VDSCATRRDSRASLRNSIYHDVFTDLRSTFPRSLCSLQIRGRIEAVKGILIRAVLLFCQPLKAFLHEQTGYK
jgi:hypothetical protein